MKRFTTFFLVNALLLLVFAQLALAGDTGDHGEGWYGETDDLAITKGFFMVIAGFPLFILLASIAYHWLDNRKDKRKKAEKARMARADQRGGW
ncbi:MAG: hypothetical protein QOF76_252 [Solirubrobacteraceae bacterium]|jgi:hypothetical protein|nr:hypothetical protein [Solirubrobacteraceae bacterium]